MHCSWSRGVFSVIALAASLILAGGCRRPAVDLPAPVRGTNRIGSLEIVEENLPPADLTKVPRPDLPRHIEAIYRLKPDRRFIYAVSEVRRLLGGAQETAHVRHVEGGGWSVRLGAAEVGGLPELPAFADGLAFVRTWAAEEWKRAGRLGEARAAAADLARLNEKVHHSSYFDLLCAEDRINQLAAKAPHDPELMRLAGRGLLALNLETLDTMEILDPVLGRAMALIALSEAVSSRPAEPGDLSVLAWQLGYEREALDIANPLSPEDPWGLFLNRDSSRLEAMATASKDPFVTVLAMKAFAAKSDSEGVHRVATGAGVVGPELYPALATVASMGSFSLQPGFNQALEEAAFYVAVETHLPEGREVGPSLLARIAQFWRRVRGRPPEVPLPVEARLQEFEGAVRSQARRLDGPFVDRVAFASLLRAPLYAALLAQANYYFDELGSTPDAEKWVALFKDAPVGTAAELKRWAEDRLAVRKGTKGGEESISRDVATLRSMGVGPIQRLVFSLSTSSGTMTDPLVRRPARGMFDGMDSRPAHLIAASWAARELLYDLKRYRRFATAAVRLAPGAVDPSELALVLESVNDKELLWRIADRVDLPTGARATALMHLLDAEPGRADMLVERVRALADEVGPDASYGLTNNVVWMFERLHRREDADREIDRWLETRGPSAGLAYDGMMAYKAARMRHQGHIRQAWDTVRQVVESWKGDCLNEATYTLLNLGRCDEALEVARAAEERYPEGGGEHALVAEVLWRQGEFEKAAKELKAALQQRPEGVWPYDVAPAFVDDFCVSNLAEARKAIAELEKAGVEHAKLRMLGEGVASQGDHLLAFEILASIPGTDQAGRDALLLAFRELGLARGHDAAVASIHERMPVLSNTALIQAYQVGADELFWGYPGDPSSLQMSFASRTLQAAAWARAAHPDEAARAKILADARRQPPKTWDSVAPRYLVRDTDEQELLPLADDLGAICNVAWMIGTRKASEGDFAAANDWFQVAVETGQVEQPPHAYSNQLMSKWIQTGKGLEQVQADRLLFF